MWESVLVFLEVYTEEIAAAAGIGALTTLAYQFVIKPFRKDKKLELGDDTVKKLNGERPEDGPRLTIVDFIRIRREMKEDLERELASAPDAEKDQLRARIAELESQIANPDKALAEALMRIADLEKLLQREANQVGAERVNEARDALERGDYSIADALFAEIEAARELDVQEAARAAYGRGEIAEAEVRWADAATHYQKAARLDPSVQTLAKAGELLWRAGQYGLAIEHEEKLVALAKREFGADHAETATALNNLAESYRAAGRYNEAEPLFREALAIDRKALGTDHPDYATRLNNLAGLLRATGRFDEAEPLFREALAIDRKTLGTDHPAYATDLNNLAGLLEDTGRFDEAEPLFREALAIDRKALGTDHPDYATRLNNLAALLRASGRFDEAEPLFREALAIDRKALGTDHPDYAIDLNNLAALLRATGRYNEAEPLFREAVQVVEAALGAAHPNAKTARRNLEIFLEEQVGREQ